MIVNLQYLRGIAAMMVVTFHITDSPGRLGAALVLPSFSVGQAGVDIFFVLSGFIMWVTTARRSETPGGFFLRRVERIAPLYWLLTLALTAVALTAPSLLRATQFDALHFTGSMLFLPVMHPTLHLYNPVLFVGWTLNYEMAFYLLFAAALFLPQWARLTMLMLALTGLVLAGLIAQPTGVVAFYTQPIILEFAFGVLIGVLYQSAVSFRRTLALALLALGALALALASRGEHSPILSGLPATLIVLGAAMHEKKGAPLFASRPLLLLGNASYSIYLTHILTIPICQIVWQILGLPVNGAFVALYIATLTSACALGGIITYFILERPLLALTRGTKRARRPQLEPAGPPH
ncbi:acyltransferase [Jiella sp. MQZ9-1]|uniref:Acyltransferase n=1 Tax=Jiella flava TaxID=2816857 RepID=A0A939FWY2_9HYPH|nr:acyltransferase [Jiella flava]MBO0662379.1 acyltransferase [Jiella flava]MCD2471603.1 acyltransferase [Jiella flava]